MKILYVTDFRKIAQHSGGFINDYLNDLTFHGFYELWRDGLIDEIVDSTPVVPLYQNYQSDIPRQNLWGGFTSCWLIPSDNICRDNLLEKIKDKYFDLVIYGSVRRCSDYFDIVKTVYQRKQIVFLDGNDDNDIDPISNCGHYFKRELADNHQNVKPIALSIPSEKITKTISRNKEQEFGTVIPGEAETYIFTQEKDYYLDYQKSYFGVTMKKAGWDCMRHYEILANGCMPYFLDLENCPDQCLFNFPKKAVQSAMKLADWEFNETEYFELLDYVFQYTKEKLTTKAIAKYILETL